MVTQKADSRRQRKKDAVREQIIASGIRLFSDLGIENVTVDRIAEAADVGKGTIYNYFQTKEEILVAFMTELERRVQARLHRFTSSKGSLDAVLVDFIRFQFRFKSPHRKFVRVFLSQMFLRTEELLPYMAEMQRVIDPPLEKLFRSLQESGAIRKDVGLSDLTSVFKTIHLGLTALWAIEGPPFRGTERILRQEMKLFCEGLRGTRS